MEIFLKNIGEVVKNLCIEFIAVIKEVILSLWNFILGIFTNLFGENTGGIILVAALFLLLMVILTKIINR